LARTFSALSEPSRNEKACTSPRGDSVGLDINCVGNNPLSLLKTYGEQLLHRVPDLNQQIRDMQEETANQLDLLGKPPSDDSIGEINSLIDQLVYDIEGGIERRGREDRNLLCEIEDEAVKLKQGLRETCPEFCAWRKDKVPTDVVLPDIFREEGDPLTNPGTRNIIYLDEVTNKRTR
jgi:hypothetical protein